ncbi:aspartyl protease family protein [Pontibacter akesuensis]|nr:aspartyl protease family protein [Pontibacter akesuensis]
MKKSIPPSLRMLPAFGVACLLSIGIQSCSFIRGFKALTAGEARVVLAPDTIPFAYHHNKIIVQGQVNGKTYDFVLDTGAPTVIWEEVAQDLKLAKARAAVSSTDANGTRQQLNFYAAESLKLGNLEVEGINLSSVSTLADEIKCYANGGIIGGNFMRHYHWQIDYENQRLIVSSDFSRLSVPKNATRVNATVTLPQGLVVIDGIRVLGKEEEFTLDTGNGGSLNLGMQNWDAAKASEMGSYAEANGYSNLSTGGRKTITTNTIKTDFTSPMDTIPNAIIQVDTKNSLLGNHYLAQFGTITIDYSIGKGAVYFNPKKETAPDAMSYGFLPVFKKESNAFVVGKIYKGSEAEKAGLQLDDRILSINGKALSEIDYATYCDNISSGKASYVLEGDTVSLIVQRNGQQLDFRISKYSLFN